MTDVFKQAVLACSIWTPWHRGPALSTADMNYPQVKQNNHERTVARPLLQHLQEININT
jgi:hypothetical protein